MWSNSKSDNLDWRFHRSYTQTINTAPSADHTTGLGLYCALPLLVAYKQENMYKLNKIRPLASTDDSNFDLLKSSDHTQPHSIIAK